MAPGVRVLASYRADDYAWSSDGSRLGYGSDEGVWEIGSPDFTTPRQLIASWPAGSRPFKQISWSPDGSKLAFVGSRQSDDWFTIWLANADGSNVRDLLPPGAPFLSPGVRAVGISAWLSSNELGFSEHCGTGCVAFHKVNMETGSYWTLGWVSEDGGAYWDWAKRRLVVETHLGGLGILDVKNFKAVSSHSAGSSREARFASVLHSCDVRDGRGYGKEYRFDSWSPDGGQLLYTEWECLKAPFTESRASLSLWQPDKNRREPLARDAGWGSWSPDGSMIAFLVFGNPRYDQAKRIVGTDFALNKPFQLSLAVMDAAKRAVRTLAPLPVDQANAGKIRGDWFARRSLHPDWSPDGKWLLVRGIAGELILIRHDGSVRVPITKGGDVEASWSPDPKKLILLLKKSEYIYKTSEPARSLTRGATWQSQDVWCRTSSRAQRSCGRSQNADLSFVNLYYQRTSESATVRVMGIRLG